MKTITNRDYSTLSGTILRRRNTPTEIYGRSTHLVKDLVCTNNQPPNNAQISIFPISCVNIWKLVQRAYQYFFQSPSGKWNRVANESFWSSTHRINFNLDFPQDTHLCNRSTEDRVSRNTKLHTSKRCSHREESASFTSTEQCLRIRNFLWRTDSV